MRRIPQNINEIFNEQDATFYTQSMLRTTLILPDRISAFHTVESEILKAWNSKYFLLLIPPMVYHLVKNRQEYDDYSQINSNDPKVLLQHPEYLSKKIAKSNSVLIEKCFREPYFSKFVECDPTFVAFLYYEKGRNNVGTSQKKKKQSLQLLKKALDAIKKEPRETRYLFALLEAEIYFELSNWHYVHQNNNDERYEFLKRSLREMRNIKIQNCDIDDLAVHRKVIIEFCLCLENRKKYDFEASELLMEYLNRSKVKHAKDLFMMDEFEVLKHLGLCFKALGKKRKALEIFQRGLKISQGSFMMLKEKYSENPDFWKLSIPYRFYLGSMKVLIAQVYVEMGKYEEYEKYSKEAEILAKEIRNKPLLVQLKQIRKIRERGKKVKSKRVEKVCALCGQKSDMRCSRCCLVYYCSRECQKKDWKSHKTKCIVLFGKRKGFKTKQKK